MAKKKALQEIEIVKVPEVVVKKELVLEGDPDKQLEFAHKAAKTLMTWVSQKPKKVMIRGEQYLEFGDWQILGRFYGATVGIEWTKPIDKGWEARATVLRNAEVISSAEAMCTREEKNWKDRDEFMLKSMAQTRASAKALRQAFGWVAELAGMKSTPAEEMDSMYDTSPIPKNVVPTVHMDEEPKKLIWQNPVQDVTAQRNRIFTLLKGRGVDVTDGDACRTYVADETQLELTAANYKKIIETLEK